MQEHSMQEHSMLVELGQVDGKGGGGSVLK